MRNPLSKTCLPGRCRYEILPTTLRRVPGICSADFVLDGTGGTGGPAMGTLERA
jgi:hypothetical protein